MKNRIKELRERMGWSQEQLAQRANTTNQQIGKLENGSRRLTVEWMERLSKPLGVRPGELLPVEAIHHRIPLVGEVQAGKWHPANEEWQEPEEFDIPLPEAYQGLRPFALRVAGPSMNLIYPEGTILVCCHIEDLQEQPLPGKRYIIENIDPADGIETTVKELALDAEGRPWAWPRSSDPRFQQPLALDQAPNGHTILVKARVIFSLKPE